MSEIKLLTLSSSHPVQCLMVQFVDKVIGPTAWPGHSHLSSFSFCCVLVWAVGSARRSHHTRISTPATISFLIMQIPERSLKTVYDRCRSMVSNN